MRMSKMGMPLNGHVCREEHEMSEKPSADSTLSFSERIERLEQRGKRFVELVAIKKAEISAAEPSLDETTLNERAEEAAGEQLAKE
jgi:hypothetical protein